MMDEIINSPFFHLNSFLFPSLTYRLYERIQKEKENERGEAIIASMIVTRLTKTAAEEFFCSS